MLLKSLCEIVFADPDFLCQIRPKTKMANSEKWFKPFCEIQKRELCCFNSIPKIGESGSARACIFNRKRSQEYYFFQKWISLFSLVHLYENRTLQDNTSISFRKWIIKGFESGIPIVLVHHNSLKKLKEKTIAKIPCRAFRLWRH